ncbi:hypothetical protein F2Q69_00045119 [Brassica cretica]|uniref:Uncharacterized protein n=1 Tax=Brassica cretica TaxID=69181 RepID=A0A8S9NM80_BRACR|nr:hypothetical protein F2Q69_00045119 [Brassica cretica]
MIPICCDGPDALLDKMLYKSQTTKDHKTLAMIPICCDGPDALLDQMFYKSQTGCPCWRPDAQLEQMSVTRCSIPRLV